MLAGLKNFIFLEALMVIGVLIARRLFTRDVQKIVDGNILFLIFALPVIGFLLPGGRYAMAAALVVMMLAIGLGRAGPGRVYLSAVPLLPPLGYQLYVGSIYITMSSSWLWITIGSGLAFLMKPSPGRLGLSFLDFAVLVLALVITLIDLRQIQEPLNVTIVGRALLGASLAVIVPYLIISRALSRPAVLEKALVCFAFVALLLSVEAIFETLRRWPLYDGMYRAKGVDLGLSSTLAVRGGLLRAPGPFQESTSFGVFLALAFLLVTQMRGYFRTRNMHLAAVGLVLMALVATSSRGAWVGAVVGVAAIAFYRARYARLAQMAGAGVVGVLAILAGAAVSTRFSEFVGLSAHGASTADYRESLVSAVLNAVADSPMTGIDQDQAQIALVSLLQNCGGRLMVDLVNSYMTVLLYVGVLGLIGFVLAIITAFSILLRRRRLGRPPEARIDMEAAMFGCLVAYSLMIYFTSFVERNPLWLALLLAVVRVVSASQAVRAQRRGAARGVGAPPAVAGG